MPTSQRAARLRLAWRAIGWFGVGLVIALSLMRNPPDLHVEDSDKLLHAAAYAVLMLWFCQLHLSARERLKLGIALLALGIGIEFAQALTTYRSFSLADMVADAIGITLGWLAAPPRLPNLLAVAQRAVSEH